MSRAPPGIGRIFPCDPDTFASQWAIGHFGRAVVVPSATRCSAIALGLAGVSCAASLAALAAVNRFGGEGAAGIVLAVPSTPRITGCARRGGSCCKGSFVRWAGAHARYMCATKFPAGKNSTSPHRHEPDGGARDRSPTELLLGIISRTKHAAPGGRRCGRLHRGLA